ncbi:MAG: glycosyltransferase family 2 protein [Oscillospiraceae bacterium]|nr:glycosyltransferase family 2 protein [Oscillospiraceae bacterium]
MAEQRAPFTTVIMPAYNADGSIAASVRSVLDQTVPDLRLIVVDDGSTDRTRQVLDALAREDPRLLPLTVENGGPAAARNRALELLDADTDFVMFLDADDLLLPDALAYALEGTRAGADLVIFGFTILGTDGSLRDYCEPEQLLPAEELGTALPRLYKANLLNQVWGKLFRAEPIRRAGIRFPDYRWGEDRLFVFSFLEQARSVHVLPDCKYRYIMHEGESLISRYYDRKFPVCLEVDQRMEALCRRFAVNDEADCRYMFAKSVFSCLTTLFAPSCPLGEEEKRQAVQQILDEPQVRRRCRDTRAGLPTELLCRCLRSGSAGLNLLVFRLVAWTGQTAPALFMALKHRK